jgi:heterodisulfide reductase subunit C
MSETNAHEFRELIKRFSGEDVGKCIQCGKCTAGCPVALDMDFVPNQVMQLIRMNEQDSLLNANTFWYCASCQTCSVRCPEDIDIAKIMNTLRRLVFEKNLKPKVSKIAQFNRTFLESIGWFGRVYELGMVMKYNLITGQPLKDALFAPALFGKGKISLLPHKIKAVDLIKKIIKRGKIFLE